MKRVGGAAGVHHKFYVPILHSFCTHIHKNLTFKCWISCCSTLPGIYSSPGLPSCAFFDEQTQPYSNHNKVLSVTTNKTNTFTHDIINPSQHNGHLNTQRAAGNKTGSVSINLTVKCVHITTDAMKKQEVLHILSVCLQLSLSSIQSVWLYHIFPHYLINSTIFGKKQLNINVCFVWNTSHNIFVLEG